METFRGVNSYDNDLSLASLSNSTVLVVGASGFIGSHLVDTLLNLKCKVIALSRHGNGLISSQALENRNLTSYYVDIRDKVSLESVFTGVDYAVHLASSSLPQASNNDPYLDIQANLLGSLNVLQHSITYGVKKLIFISSGGTVYGNPIKVPIPEDHPNNPRCSYGIVKLAIEKYINLFRELYGLDSLVLRLANPYGERPAY